VLGYLIAATLARLADEMTATTIVLLVLDRTGSTALAGAAVAAYTVPSALSGPVLGAVLDRLRRRADILVLSGISLAAACTAMSVLVGHGPAIAVIGAMVVAGAAVPLTAGGYSSLVVRIVPAQRRARGNALDASAFSVAAIAGPGVAGLLSALAGTTVAVLTLAAIAVAGAVCTVPLRRLHGEPGERRSTLEAIRAGFGHLVRTPGLRGPTVTTVLGWGSFGALSVALPLWTEELGAGTTAAGFLLTALEAGDLAVTLVLAHRLKPERAGRVVLVCTALFGVAMGGWLLTHSLTQALVVAVIAGVAQGLTLPAIFAVRQHNTPDALLGQVSVTGASMKIGGYALGALMGTALVPAVGPRGTIAVVACCQVIAAGAGRLLSRGAVHPGTP
jgi:MFS family permease